MAFHATYSGISLIAQTDPGAGHGLESKIDHTWVWPPWITLLLLISAAAFVLFIYLKEHGPQLPLKLFLAAVRFSLIGLTIFMLYGWLRYQYRTDLPDVAIIMDDSESMALADHYEDKKVRKAATDLAKAAGFDEASRINLAKSLLLRKDGALLEALQRRYNVKSYLVASAARPEALDGRRLAGLEAAQPSSRLGRGVRDVLEAQRGRPTAAVIMFTDGITTEGESISETAQYARRKSIPLFLVGVGSGQSPRDVRLSELLVDEVVFVDDVVNFEFKLTGSGYEGEGVTLQLKRGGDGKVLAEKVVDAGKDGEAVSVRLSHRPHEKGDFEYVVEARPLDGEANEDNNRQTRLVSVRDETIRVLMVQAYPSYEFRYLKALLGRELKSGEPAAAKAIALTTVLQEADLEYADLDETAERVFPVRRDELFEYDAIIFGDVNPSHLSRSVMSNIADFVTQRGGGIVFTAGPRYTPLAYRDTPLAELMPIDLEAATVPDPDATLSDPFFPQPTRLGLSSPQMQLGATPADSFRIWQKLPGMYWLLEAPSLKPAARVLAEHPTRTGNLGRNLPVICVQYVGAGKVVFHATDETWRWRYRVGDAFFGRYWLQTIRYLSRSKLLGSTRSAELTSDREQYRRGDAVRLRVRFFDDRLAPPEDDGVTIVVEREGGRRRHVRLGRDAAARGVFEGTVGNLADGRYRAWMATPTLDGNPPSRRFAVVAPPGEQARLAMEADELKLAAEVSHGEFYTIQSVRRLLDDLPPGRQVRIEALPPTPIWNWWVFALLFVALIATEWLLRKRAGML